MVDFSTLKRSSSTSFQKLTEELTKLNSNSFQSSDDTRDWTPTVDKAGNGYAVIRFLPAPANEDIPFVRLWDHGFQGPTGLWYIEKSLTTLGKQDPVAEYNSVLWNASTDDESPQRKQARKQKRRLYYVSNVYVVSDPSNPDNNGKVFLFKYGKKIFDKLNDLMNPQFPDDSPVNPFDFWAGANFKLKIRKVEGYRNYDKSEFDTPTPLMSDDEDMERIWNTEIPLQELLDQKHFKPYDELKAKLNRVLAVTISAVSEAPRQSRVEKETLPWNDPPKAATTKSAFEEDDDDLEFLKKLAEDD